MRRGWRNRFDLRHLRLSDFEFEHRFGKVAIDTWIRALEQSRQFACSDVRILASDAMHRDDRDLARLFGWFDGRPLPGFVHYCYQLGINRAACASFNLSVDDEFEAPIWPKAQDAITRIVHKSSARLESVT
jgi:hypothetical protein